MASFLLIAKPQAAFTINYLVVYGNRFLGEEVFAFFFSLSPSSFFVSSSEEQSGGSSAQDMSGKPSRKAAN